MTTKLTFEVNGPEFRLPADIRRIIDSMGTRRYSVTVVPLYGNRTRLQNAYFHMIIGRISAFSGADKEYIKEAVKDLAVTMGYPPATDDDGKPLLTPSGEFIPKPSHEANRREMGLLIDAALYFASEQGCEIDPDTRPDKEVDE